jgi:predicted neutral ceramidase superfamily lipid hydrolase
MGEKAKVKETVRLYSKVWQLPSYQGIVLRTFGMVFISSFIFAVIAFPQNGMAAAAESFLLYSALLLSVSFVGSALLYLIVRKKGSPLDARRALGAAQFALMIWFAMGALGGIIDFLFATLLASRMWILGMALGYLAFSFLVTGLSDFHPVRNFIAAAMPAAIWITSAIILSQIPTALPILPPFWFLVIPIVIIVDSVAVHYIFKSVSRPFERDLGINGPELLRAFGYDYLADNPQPFEALMTQIGVTQDVPLELVIFKSGTDLLAVGVVLYVHPGPFRDIGSSGLPSRVIEHIREKHGVQAIVFHGSCTHHQNLTNKIDYDLIMSEIDQLIERARVYNQASGLHWTDEGKFKVWSFFAGEDVLAITTSAPEFTDDIALEVGRAAAQKARESVSSIRYVALSDAHNCIDGDAVSLMPGDPEEAAYIQAVTHAIQTNVSVPRSELSVGISQMSPEYISEREGVGPGGVVALVVRVGDKTNALISIDGNNVEPGYRDQIQALLGNEGFDNVELTTTDTHVVNAISLSSRGYPPVGRFHPEELKETIRTAALSARDSMRETSVGLAFGEIRNLRTFGERGFDTLTQDVAEAAGIAKRTGIYAAGAAFLVSLVLSFIL